VIVNPLATQFADRHGARKRLATRLALVGALTATAFTMAEGFWLVLAVAVFHTIFQAPVLPLSENLILLTARARDLDYGRMRLWGSIAFIASSTGAGYFFVGRPDALIMWVLIGCLVLVWATAKVLPDVRTPPADTRHRPVRQLLTNRLFLVFVLCAALNMASHAVLHGFGTLHWQAMGLDNDIIGLLWGVGVVAEIILFAFSRALLARTGIVGMLAIGAGAGVVRWIGLGLTTEVWALVLFQILHGFTFGATHLGAMTFIQRAVPATLSATAQGLYSSLSMGVFVGLTMIFAGHLYAAFAGRAFLAMAALSGASLIVTLVLHRMWRSSDQIV
jgi:PPP family 3-phenylpropionic acid transporter